MTTEKDKLRTKRLEDTKTELRARINKYETKRAQAQRHLDQLSADPTEHAVGVVRQWMATTL